MKPFFLALITWASLSFAFEPSILRCGGEGPKPMMDVTNGFNAGTRIIPTRGGIQDFVFWNKKNTLVYRDKSSRVIEQPLEGCGGGPISTSTVPLARIVDEDERYLLTEHDSWFLDTEKTNRWIHYENPSSAVEHLFWSGDSLFSISNFFTSTAPQTLRLIHYRAGESSANVICPNLKLRVEDGLHVGMGNVYPNVFMHRTRTLEEGTELSVYKLDLRTCGMEALGTYTHLLPGHVETVYWFESLGAIAVKIDHPTMNLMWDAGPNGCRFFDIGKERPMVLNYNHPMLASWKAKEGMTLYYLNSEKRASIPLAGAIRELAPEDVILANDGQRLFAAPRLADSSKILLEMKLPPNP